MFHTQIVHKETRETTVTGLYLSTGGHSSVTFSRSFVAGLVLKSLEMKETVPTQEVMVKAREIWAPGTLLPVSGEEFQVNSCFQKTSKKVP